MFGIFKRLKKLETQVEFGVSPSELQCLKGHHEDWDLATQLQKEYQVFDGHLFTRYANVYEYLICCRCKCLFLSVQKFDPNRIDHVEAKKRYDDKNKKD